MSTTYRTNTNLREPAYNDSSWNVPNDANFDDLDASPMYGGLCCSLKEVPSGSLNVKVSAGRYRKADGTLATYAGTASQALTASTTNYIYLTDSGTLTVSTSSWPATFHVPLAVAVCGGSTITTLTDSRVPLVSSGAALSTLFVTLATADSGGVVVVNTGTTNGTQWGASSAAKQAWWGATPAAQPSGASQAAVGTLALQTLTVSTGGTPGTTLAAATNTSAVTDSTGGSASTTLAAATNVATLTDSTGGTASTTLATISDAPTANAVASLAAQHALQRSLNTVLINAVASLAARLAEQRTLNTVLINTVTSLGTQMNNALADINSLKTLTNGLRTGLVTSGQIKGSA